MIKNWLITVAIAVFLLLNWNFYNVISKDHWNNQKQNYITTVSYKTENLYVGLNINDRTIPLQLSPNDYMNVQEGCPYSVELTNKEVGKGVRITMWNRVFAEIMIGIYIFLLIALTAFIINKTID